MDDTALTNEAIRQGLITFAQAQECLNIVNAGRANGLTLQLSEILIRKGFMTQAQIDAVAAPPRPSAPELSTDDQRLGNEAIRLGYITFMQIQECLAAGPGKKLSDTLVERGLVTRSQVDAILGKPEPAPPDASEELILREAVSRGYVTASQLQECVMQAGIDPKKPRLADVLISKGFMTAAQIESLSQPAPTVPAPIPRIVGPYEILGEIEPALYKAKKPDQERLVALRLLPEAFSSDAAAVEKIKREAKPRVALSHPNLVKYVAFGVIDKRYFVAMEFVEGRPLSELIRQKGSIDEPTVVRVGLQVAAALAAVHAAGLKHLDIRPERILIESGGGARLMELSVRTDGPPDLPSLASTLSAMIGGPAKNEALQEVLSRLGGLEAPAAVAEFEKLADAIKPAKLPPRRAAKAEEKTPMPAKKSSKKSKLILAGSGAAVLLMIVAILIVALSSPNSKPLAQPPSPDGPTPPPRAGADPRPEITRQVLAEINAEKFNEAAKRIEREAPKFSAGEVIVLRTQVREAALSALSAVRRAVDLDLRAGAYDEARAKLEQFRPRVAEIPDVLAELDRSLARVDAEKEQNLARRVDEEYERLGQALAPLLEKNRYDDALARCRDALARTNDPRLLKLISDRVREIQRLKDSAAGKPPEPDPSPEPKPPPAPAVDVSRFLEQARAAFQAREFDKAADLLGEAIAKAPDHAEARGLRARCYCEKGEFERARKEAQRALEADPQAPDALYVMSFMGTPEEAIEFLTRAIKGRPDFAAAFLRRAQCALNAGRPETAPADTVESARLDGSPENRRECFRIRVEALARLSEFDKAIAECGEWIKLDPKDKAPLLARADLHLKKDKPADAKKDFQAVLKLDPKDAEAKTRLADLEKPGGAKPPPSAKSDRERREILRKKLMDYFNGLQEQIVLLEDGRYRVTLVYDFSTDKQYNDFKTNGKNNPGILDLKSKNLDDPGVVVWNAKIKGDFTAKLEYLVTEVNDREMSGITLRSTSSADVNAQGDEGVGFQLANTTAYDLKEWKHRIVRFGQRAEILTDRDNPALVRHQPKERESVWLKRDAATYVSKYGQSPEIKATSEGPDAHWMRLVVVAASLRLVRFEIQAYLDPEFVAQLFPADPK